jgi:protein-disulfide isomerase
MIYRIMLRCWAVLLLGVLAACGSQPTPASIAPTAAAPPPTRAPAAPPTVAALIAPTAAVAQAPATAPSAATAQPGNAAAIPSSLTPEGYHVLGRPDAPVTLVMYSDFL